MRSLLFIKDIVCSTISLAVEFLFLLVVPLFPCSLLHLYRGFYINLSSRFYFWLWFFLILIGT